MPSNLAFPYGVVKAGDVLLACYTLSQCVLILLLAKFVTNRTLSTCA
jgi:hypothetical protein